MDKYKLLLKYNTMETTKKKFDWARLWEIIKIILITFLTGETATRLL